jgi:hypothetical protein
MDYWSLKEKFFTWVVKAMADLCIAKAKSGRSQLHEMHWSNLINLQAQDGARSGAAPPEQLPSREKAAKASG